MQANASEDDISVTHPPAADELLPPPEQDIADDNPSPHIEPATIMTSTVPWFTKRASDLEIDAVNIQAWLAAVRLIIVFQDASQLLTNAVPRTEAGRALARQIIFFLSQTTDGSLSSCLFDDVGIRCWHNICL
jgi:hypothetical protein